MTRPRWRLEADGPAVEIHSGEEAHHYFSRVVRLRPGEEAAFFRGDGEDRVYRLVSGDRERLCFEFVHTEKVLADPRVPLELWLPCLKGSGAEEVIRSVVPLGVAAVRVYLSDRSVSRPGKDRTERRRKVAEEAVRQCGRTKGVEIPPEAGSLAELLADLSEKPGIVFHEESETGLREVLDDLRGRSDEWRRRGLVVVTGPEGGFSDEELHAVRQTGLAVCSLGPTVLRAELAPIVALAMVGYGVAGGCRTPGESGVAGEVDPESN